MDILVPQKYSPLQLKSAAAKRAEFKRNTYTSGSANLDDMIALGKAVILCASHARRFNAPHYKYSLHPDKKMQKVIGNCDVCKDYGMSFLFLNERDAHEERKKLEKFKRALEYGNLLR